MRNASKVAMCRAEIPKLAYDNNTLEFWTTCGADDQFSSPKQIRCCPAGSPLAGKLLVAQRYLSAGAIGVWDSLTTVAKFAVNWCQAVDADVVNIYTTRDGFGLYKYDYSYALVTGHAVNTLKNPRMIDASGHASYVFATSNNATDGHGIRMVKKATMTVSASKLATGTGDNQFTDPFGLFYVANTKKLYVAEATRICVLTVGDTDGAESLTWDTSYAIAGIRDLFFDGTNWFTISATKLTKWDSVFTDATKVEVSVVGYSITDCQNGNLALVDNANSHLALYAKSNLAQVGSDVGSSGDGSASLFDPVITCVGGGTWYTDDGRSYYAASGASPSQNGFTGIFWASAGPHRVTFRPAGGLGAVTGLDSNSDLIRQDIKNIYKCINLTSLKLQTNTTLLLDLGRLTSKLVTIWAYACGVGISGSIRHMTAATSINLRENGASQAQVDALIDDLWQNRDVMAICAVNLNGTNAAPSGVYQDASPPTTGREKVFDLVENYGWTVATT